MSCLAPTSIELRGKAIPRSRNTCPDYPGGRTLSLGAVVGSRSRVQDKRAGISCVAEALSCGMGRTKLSVPLQAGIWGPSVVVDVFGLANRPRQRTADAHLGVLALSLSRYYNSHKRNVSYQLLPGAPFLWLAQTIACSEPSTILARPGGARPY